MEGEGGMQEKKEEREGGGNGVMSARELAKVCGEGVWEGGSRSGGGGAAAGGGEEVEAEIRELQFPSSCRGRPLLRHDLGDRRSGYVRHAYEAFSY